MFYLISQQLVVCLFCLFIGLFMGYILWGLRAKSLKQDRAELAELHRLTLSLQEQLQKNQRRMAELESEADTARKFAAKKESSVTQLIADKGSLLADVRMLEKEVARLKGGA